MNRTHRRCLRALPEAQQPRPHDRVTPPPTPAADKPSSTIVRGTFRYCVVNRAYSVGWTAMAQPLPRTGERSLIGGTSANATIGDTTCAAGGRSPAGARS